MIIQIRAANIAQGSYRIWKARKVTREKAYQRYQKHFDANSGNYYYEDKRTKKTMWEKPKSLGSYDCEGIEGWVLMKASNGSMLPILFH